MRLFIGFLFSKVFSTMISKMDLNKLNEAQCKKSKKGINFITFFGIMSMVAYTKLNKQEGCYELFKYTNY